MSGSRKATIIVLIILTLFLAGLSIFIAVQVNQDVGVDDGGSAGESCTPGGEIECSSGFCCNCNMCSSNSSGNDCSTVCGTDASCSDDTQCEGKSNGYDLGCQGGEQPFRCKCVAVACPSGGTGSRLVVNCATSDPSCGPSDGGGDDDGGGGGDDGGGGGGTSCVIDNPSVTGSMTISSGCGPLQGSTYSRAAAAGTTDADCVGTSTNEQEGTFGPGTVSISGACGQCIQIDVTYNGQDYGIAGYTGDCEEEPPPTPNPFCGDGVKQSTEQCDPLANPTGCAAGQTCSDTCVCAANPFCGDGTINNGEVCDYNANPTGCPTGQTCTNNCICRIPVIPQTAIFGDSRDYLIYGIFLTLIGFVVYKYGFGKRLLTEAYVTFSTSDLAKKARFERRLEKQRNQFEKRNEE